MVDRIVSNCKFILRLFGIFRELYNYKICNLIIKVYN